MRRACNGRKLPEKRKPLLQNDATIRALGDLASNIATFQTGVLSQLEKIWLKLVELGNKDQIQASRFLESGSDSQVNNIG